MADRHDPDDLMSFPCLHQFKAFGAVEDEAFQGSVLRAVSQVVPVGREAVRTRLSSGGRYQCVTVLVHLQNSAQLKNIYGILRDIKGLLYLL
jgi:putative lipoic acid-binding regulatory protein